jgi:gliding motility-associated-like protein
MCSTLSAQAPGVLPFGYLQGYDFSTEPMTRVQTKMRANQAFDGQYAGVSNCLWNCDGSIKYFSGGYNIFNGNSGDTILGSYHYNKGNAIGYNVGNININNYFIPKPGSNDTVYFFYTYNSNAKPWKLAYAIIDNRGDGGKGEVVKKGIVLQNKHFNMHFTRHSNGRWWWLVTAWNEDSAAAYLISDSGISLTPIFSKCISNVDGLNAFSPQTESWGGAFRLSHNGKYLLSTGIDENVNPIGNVLLYDFDNTTGKLSNPKVLLKKSQFPHPEMQTYTAEFSPNDSFVFVSTKTYSSLKRPPYLLQINVNTKQVYRHIIGKAQEYAFGHALTIITAPNNTVFGMFGLSDNPFLNIKYPNKWGAAVKIAQWNDSNAHNLTQFPEPIFTYKNAIWESNLTYAACADSASFTYTGDTSFAWLKWQFGDGDSVVFYPPLKPKFTFWHTYRNPGKYYVRMQARQHICNGNNWFGDTLEFKPNPQRFSTVPPSLTSFCDSALVLLEDSLVNTRSWYLKSSGIGTPDSANWNSSSGSLNKLQAKSVFYNDTDQAILTLILQAPNGCTKSYLDTAQIQLLEKPINTILVDSLLCEGSEFLVEDTAPHLGDTLFWNYAGISRSGFALRSARYIAQKAKDTVFLTVHAANGCKSTTKAAVQIAPRPFAFINVDDTLCQGDTLVANAANHVSGAVAYWDWDKTITGPIAANKSFKATTTQAGSTTLGLVLKSTQGCADTQVIAMAVFPTPQAHFNMNDILCSNAQIKLLGDGNVPNQKNRWYINGTLYTMDSSVLIRDMSKGKQVVSHAAVTAQGCYDSASSMVTVLAAPDAIIASRDTSFCEGVPFTIAKYQDTGISIWQWNSTIQGQDTFIIAQGAAAGSWPLQLINTYGNGCSDTAVIGITIHPKPQIAINYAAPVCLNDTVLFEQTGTGANFAWEAESNVFNTSALLYSFTSAGKHTVRCVATSAVGCSNSDEAVVQVHPVPTVKIRSTGNSFNETLGYAWYFNTEPDSFITYNWQFGAGGNSDESNPKVYFPMPEDTQQIRVRVVTRVGCVAISDTVLVVRGLTLYHFPTAFTPNSNNMNDGFGIAGPEYVKQYKLWVFNRWGENVFYTENPTELWKPENVIPGIYIYKANVQDIYSRWKEIEGTVLLLR